MKEEKHLTKKWEVSIIEFQTGGKRYKVTRKLSDMSVAETKIFSTLDEAKKQFDEWLD